MSNFARLLVDGLHARTTFQKCKGMYIFIELFAYNDFNVFVDGDRVVNCNGSHLTCAVVATMTKMICSVSHYNKRNLTTSLVRITYRSCYYYIPNEDFFVVTSLYQETFLILHRRA